MEDHPIKKASESCQMELWKGFFKKEDGFGYTLDFWENIPKFLLTRNRYFEKAAVHQKTFLHKGQHYSVKIKPAVITVKDRAVLVFPGLREDAVYRVLLEMAADQFLGENLTEIWEGKDHHVVRAQPALKRLRKLLLERNNDYKISEIQEALKVMRWAGYEIKSENGFFLDFSILSFLGGHWLDNKKDKDGEKAFTVIEFNSFLSEAIIAARGWPIDNQKVLSLKQPLARWITTRLSHNFRQAETGSAIIGKGYTLSLTAILEESGMEREPRLRDTLARIRNALNEMKEADLLANWKPYEEILIHDSRNGKGRKQIVDAKWILFPSNNFVQDIICGNQKMGQRKSRNPQDNRQLALLPNQTKSNLTNNNN